MAETPVTMIRSVALNAPVREVWAVAGEFHGLHRWHPGVAASTREHVTGEEFRALTLADGGHRSSTFAPTAPVAEAVIAGIYDAGLSALAERFDAT